MTERAPKPNPETISRTPAQNQEFKEVLAKITGETEDVDVNSIPPVRHQPIQRHLFTEELRAAVNKLTQEPKK